jgi:HlyD family secretion protein
MRSKIFFILSGLGLLLAIASAIIFNQQPTAQKPVFNPAPDPYAKGIYATGMIESDQASGANINIFPEVPGSITQILVSEGSVVHKGDPLLTIDDTVQRATAEQQHAQAEAAQALLQELRAEPRPETINIATAQVENARSNLKNAQDQLTKQEQSYAIDPQSVSRNDLDNARNAERIAATNLDVVRKQYALTKAGAWTYDIQNQEKQYVALSKAYAASMALLDKYTIKSTIDGVVLAIQAGIGSYVSPQGAYNSYTQGMDPLIIMGAKDGHLQVRAYIDEILLHRMTDPTRLDAKMFIRGTDIKLPLTFVRVQPYVSPKIELSDQRQERVDVRVLPVIFRFEKPASLNLYQGQQVDVYIGTN